MYLIRNYLQTQIKRSRFVPTLACKSALKEAIWIKKYIGRIKSSTSTVRAGYVCLARVRKCYWLLVCTVKFLFPLPKFNESSAFAFRLQLGTYFKRICVGIEFEVPFFFYFLRHYDCCEPDRHFAFQLGKTSNYSKAVLVLSIHSCCNIRQAIILNAIRPLIAFNYLPKEICD